ncbi:MAG: glycogen/starch synthase [Desulfobacterales bacterium]|nr:glycogen/starch synthase [Desulfobacterales bacterium]
MPATPFSAGRGRSSPSTTWPTRACSTRPSSAHSACPDSLFNMNDLEFFGQVNALKAGILYSSAVTTVSPRYSREIQTPEPSAAVSTGSCAPGPAPPRHPQRRRLHGTGTRPPTSSSPATFAPADLAGKKACRDELAREFGLAAPADLPVAGMVTRLAGQKGLDIVCEALDALLGLGLTLVILGTGEPKIQDFLLAAQKKHPKRIGLKIAFDERIAHTIYAGSDLFLIPSRYEPCGLTQMYAMKYGTDPGRPGHGRTRRQRPGIRRPDRERQRLQVRRGRARSPSSRRPAAPSAGFKRPAEWRTLVGNADGRGLLLGAFGGGVPGPLQEARRAA